MKILFALPGHLKTVPMGQFCVEALNELGHMVISFDFKSSLRDKLLDRWARLTQSGQREAKNSTNQRLRNLVEHTRPDLFIALFGFDISEQSLTYLKQKHIPSACWWINDPFQFQRSLKQAPHYDFVFSNSAGSVAQYQAAGIRHANFLPTACHPAVHRPVPAKAEYQCDVCFAGDWSPVREQVLTELAPQFDVKIFGPWKKKLTANSILQRNLNDGFFTPLAHDPVVLSRCSNRNRFMTKIRNAQQKLTNFFINGGRFGLKFFNFAAHFFHLAQQSCCVLFIFLHLSNFLIYFVLLSLEIF